MLSSSGGRRCCSRSAEWSDDVRANDPASEDVDVDDLLDAVNEDPPPDEDVKDDVSDADADDDADRCATASL